MKPLLIIARFELLYQLRQPAFYLLAALIFGQGIWYTSHLITLYSYSDPVVTGYLVLSSLGVVLAIVAVLLAGQSLTKDIDYQATSHFYTLPITSWMHFAGRFMGVYTATLLLAAFYPLGILAFSSVYTPSSPALWIALVDGFVRLIAQNLFTVVSLTVSLTVFLRSIRGAYISLFLVVFYFLLTESNQNGVIHSDLWQLLDPFGVSMARESVETMAFSDSPSGFFVFSDMFFINRILWLGLALGILAYAEKRFSFEYFSNNILNKASKVETSLKSITSHSIIRLVQPNFGGWTTCRTVIQLTKREFLNLARQPVFAVTLLLLVFIAILFATSLDTHPNFPELPITSRMTALRLPMGLLISLFLLVMTVELLFLERTVGLWSIYDAFPQPTFVLLGPKLLAMVFVAALLTFVLFLTGVGIQISSGFEPIDWGRYAADLLPDGFLRYCQLIALGALIASLTNSRFMSHLVSLLIFVVLAFGYQIASDRQSIYLYSFLPGSATYSDLIGYGSKAALRPLIHYVWWGVAGLFMTSFFFTWNRGNVAGLSERFGQWRTQFQWPYQLAFIAFNILLGFSVWQTQQRLTSVSTTPTISYTTRTVMISSVSGKAIPVRIQYYHAYQVQHMVRAVAVTLRRGEQLFGAYPHADLSITETPNGTADVLSKPGQIMISEKQGWIADNRQPDKLDYIDYLIAREVFKQWLVHQLHPVTGPGDGFVKQSLAEYLALQGIARDYGPARLQQRLSQRAIWYAKSRQRSHELEPLPLQSSGDDAVERGRAALVLMSIGQVWGDKPLSLTISQFYKKAVQQPTSATATAFASELTRQLPDSLQYLQTYLNERLWFDFRIGRVANLVNGLTVEIISTKWRENKTGDRQALPINDYLPLVVLDQDDNQLYRQLVHPNPDEQFVSLPALPTARKVIIDPLGTWLEPNKRDNAKLF